MKQFRKNKEDLFICEECGKTYLKKDGLSKHINSKHDGTQEYYNKWLKENNEGNCNICNETTIFRGLHFGYKQTCENKKCKVQNTQNVLNKSIKEKYNVDNSANIPGIQDKKRKTCLEKYGVEISSQAKEVKEKAKKNNLEKYGVENVYQRKDIKEKIKHIHLKKLGVEYPSQSERIKERIKETCLKRYGVEFTLQDPSIRELGNITLIKKYGENPLQNEEIQNKKKETSLERYGVESPNQSNIVKENKKKTCLEKYGVENPMQVTDVFKKQQRAAGYRKKYKNTGISYQGTYELNFLEKYSEKIYIENGKTFKYLGEDNKHHTYFSDFFIPSKNLIIEIKGDYYYKRDYNTIKRKEKSVLKENYNYILILNKDYSEFEKTINL
jgi:hypothetical protein